MKNRFAHLSCLKSSDDTLLFSRHVSAGTGDQVKFPLKIVDNLSHIFTSGNSYGFRIYSLDSNEFKIAWRCYHSSLTLILIETLEPIDENVYFHKLDLLFDSLVFMYGLDDLISIADVETFQREIKVAFPLLDALLDSDSELFGGYMTNAVDSLLISNTSNFQLALNQTVQELESPHGCLYLGNRMIVASEAWWELKPSEWHLINLINSFMPNAASRDMPFYLPSKSSYPLRLVSFGLTSSGASLTFICSKDPRVDWMQSIIQRIWAPIYDSLVNLNQYFPRNMPMKITVDQNMIAFLLINKKTKCCTSSLCPNDKLSKDISREEKQRRSGILRLCYLNISSQFFHKFQKFKPLDLYNSFGDESKPKSEICKEAYTIIPEGKCYALNEENFEFYAIYEMCIPTHAMRGVTKTCYNLLLSA